MVDTDTFLSALYVMVEDICKFQAPAERRPGPASPRSRSKVTAVTVFGQWSYLVGTVYNFCTCRKSLRVPSHLPHGWRRWLHRTPVTAAGITDLRWKVEDLLTFRVSPTPCRPPKRRERPSYATKRFIVRWCTWSRLTVGLPYVSFLLEFSLFSVSFPTSAPADHSRKGSLDVAAPASFSTFT